MSEAIQGNGKKKRPEFRNIHVTEIIGYRLPLAALVSILHRISGLLMFLLLPFVLYLFEQSLTSEGTYEYLRLNWFAQPWCKLLLLVLVWGYLHHFCAGIRHLIMDLHIGLDKISARHSAASVLVISLSLTALIGLKIFGVF
ncbi:succinate dehydrogenase, cytochrome b556 subunit [Massilia sp. W12]|uniref:succinate dehydrogenase, cytochrome b556 subunit n=1 Tax=Massilia sp. W12 TaxID=3126507 RepID=UPI0030CC586A